jgi:hypothetical protein
VAKAALIDEQSLSALHGRGVGNRRKRLLLGRQSDDEKERKARKNRKDKPFHAAHLTAKPEVVVTCAP